jgi:nucleoside-diphosphate-sugar epimerase
MRLDLVVNRMTAEAWAHKRIMVEGGGGQQRPLIHVADAVGVFCRAIEDDFEPGTYNVGHNKMNYRIREIAAEVVEFSHAVIHYDEKSPTDERDYHLCFDKIAKYFTNYPVTIAQGGSHIRYALETGRLRLDDETTHTLRWYKHLMKLNGGPL